MKFIAFTVGISSNTVDSGGAAPKLSPLDRTNVAGIFARSAAKLAAITAAPLVYVSTPEAVVLVKSRAPWKSENALICSSFTSRTGAVFTNATRGLVPDSMLRVGTEPTEVTVPSSPRA